MAVWLYYDLKDSDPDNRLLYNNTPELYQDYVLLSRTKFKGEHKDFKILYENDDPCLVEFPSLKVVIPVDEFIAIIVAHKLKQ